MSDIHLFMKKKLSGEKITMLTCYDYSTAKILATTGLDAILVGDSLGMVVQGGEDTLSVTVEDMIYHTKAVRKGAAQLFIVTDMPFLSYHISKEDTVKNGGRILKESGANAVKLEGGREIVESVRALIAAKIPVMGHLGLTPQSFQMMGGFKVQGRKKEEARQILEDALILQEAGVFAIVLECVPEKLAALITETLEIPIIGIGSGKNTNGQVLVVQDAVGIDVGIAPKFVKKFGDVGSQIREAVQEYISEVKGENFPGESHVFKIEEEIISELTSEYLK